LVAASLRKSERRKRGKQQTGMGQDFFGQREREGKREESGEDGLKKAGS